MKVISVTIGSILYDNLEDKSKGYFKNAIWVSEYINEWRLY